MNIILGYALSFAVVFGAIGLITLIQKIFSLKGELSRKLIHILVGFTWLPLYFYLKDTVHLIIVPLIFVIVNYLSTRLTVFKAMEREAVEGKKDYGTVYFAVCMTIMSTAAFFYPGLLIPYGVAVAVLSFGDGAAALVGTYVRKNNPQLIKGKSLWGTVACFVFAIVGVLVFSLGMRVTFAWWQILLIGIAAALLELFGRKLDNFTVMFGVSLLAALFLGVF